MNFTLRKWLLASVWILLVVSCSKDDNSGNDPWNPAVSRTLSNENYGSGTRNVADIYLPAGRSANTRIVVLLHGGGWNSGDKADMKGVVDLIQRADPSLAIVNMNYTLADGNSATRHPAQMEDIAKAIQYIKAQNALWQTGDDISMLGVSAGAHLSMLYAYEYDTDQVIKAVIDVVGPSNFADPVYTNNVLFQTLAKSYLGFTWQENANLHRALSPVTHVVRQSPPTLMAYGGQDQLVPASNATAIRDAFQQAGAVYEYYFYPNEQHEFSNTTIAELVTRVVPFLNKYGK